MCRFCGVASVVQHKSINQGNKQLLSIEFCQEILSKDRKKTEIWDIFMGSDGGMNKCVIMRLLEFSGQYHLIFILAQCSHKSYAIFSDCQSILWRSLSINVNKWISSMKSTDSSPDLDNDHQDGISDEVGYYMPGIDYPDIHLVGWKCFYGSFVVRKALWLESLRSRARILMTFLPLYKQFHTLHACFGKSREFSHHDVYFIIQGGNSDDRVYDRIEDIILKNVQRRKQLTIRNNLIASITESTIVETIVCCVLQLAYAEDVISYNDVGRAMEHVSTFICQVNPPDLNQCQPILREGTMPFEAYLVSLDERKVSVNQPRYFRLFPMITSSL